MLGGGPTIVWIKNSAAITRKNQAQALCRGERDVPGPLEREGRLLAAVPAEEVPAPERSEQESDAAEQRDQRDDAPEDFVFLDPRAKDFYTDWDRSARDCVALLRSEAGRNPYDRELSDLVGELSTQSEEFRGHWAAHNVRVHNKGEKQLQPSCGRRARAQLQPAGARRRPRPDDHRLHGRARLEIRGGLQPAR